MPLASRLRPAEDASAPPPEPVDLWRAGAALRVRGAPLSIVILSDDTAWMGDALPALSRQEVHATVAEFGIAAEDPRLDACQIVLLKPARLSGDCWAACLRLGDRPGCAVVLLHDAPNPSDIVLALKLGADDCLSACLDAGEMAARLRAVARRIARSEVGRGASAPVYYFDGWRFAPAAAELRGPSGRTHHLVPNDLRLLATLLSRPGDVFTHRELTEGVDPRAGRIDWRVRIFRMRARLLKTEPAVDWLRTVRGRGYAIDAKILRVEEPLVFGRSASGWSP